MMFVFECCLKDPFKCGTSLLSGLLCHLPLNSSADVKSWDPPEPGDQTDHLAGGKTIQRYCWTWGPETTVLLMRLEITEGALVLCNECWNGLHSDRSLGPG